MSRAISVVLTLIVAIAVVAGVAYFAMSGGGRGVGPQTGQSKTGARESVSDAGSNVSASAITANGTRLPPADFAFQRLSIETNEDQPEACLVFSMELDDSGETNYADYVRLAPDVAVSMRPVGKSLCIAGLAYAESYQVTILEGMPSRAGKATLFEEVVPIELRDRPPAIAFSGGIILPREAGGRLPVTSVNVEAMEIRVLRVGDRLLSQLYEGLIDATELYSYDASQIENELGALVWEGEMEVQGAKNATVTTLFPIREAIGLEKPGVYLVLAEDKADKNRVDEQYWRGTAAQWVIDTDIALTTFDGAGGLTVQARSFMSAQPLQGVDLALVARNNDVLARVRTGADGLAQFSAQIMGGRGGNEPAVIMAYGANEDFAYADLRRPAFDLTDRGVGGRAAPGPIDAYLYLDRGIYRPGETVFATSLLRDSRTKAVENAPLTLIARRPDGVEFRRLKLTADEDGGYAAAFALSATAPRGRWQIAAYVDPDAPPVGRVSFDVQDFVPERLKIALIPKAETFKPGEEVKVAVEGRFLYGAPASGLDGEAEMRLTADPYAFSDFKTFRFGRVEEEFQSQIIPLTMTSTDNEGNAMAFGAIDLPQETTYPLTALVTVGLTEPGGRQTREQVSVPVRTRDVYLGIRPSFEDGWVRENTPATFEIVAVDAHGAARTREEVSYRLVREVVNYHWYEVDGDWRYERQTRDYPIADGKLSIEADKPAATSASFEWGSYRLIVSDAASGAQSSIRFWAGWGGSVGADRPDRVAVTLDKSTYAPGEQAVIDIRPPSDGKALIVIASDKVHATRLMDVPANGAKFYIPVEDEWGPGVYAMVTHVRPLSNGMLRAPVRAIGLAYLAIDQTAQTLGVEIAAPQTVKPKGKVTIPVTVTGAKGGAHLTVAAVDEGILQLTDFESPSPTDYFYGKRRLGVEVHDDYGRLIAPLQGAEGKIRSGGDGFAGGDGLTVVPTRTVALYSGIVSVGPDGKAEVNFTVPDFVGELRLMAVAWTSAQVGAAAKAVQVREAVVADVSLPRFLAPADEATATLLVDNVSGPAGTYKAVLTASGSLTAGSEAVSFELEQGAREIAQLPIRGGETGIGTVGLKLVGPGGFELERAWPIEVRPPQRPTAVQTVAKLGPGETLTLPAERFDAFVKDTATMSVSLASSRGFDVPALLRALDRYPYGCLEQTTSRAFPLLVYNDLAAQSGLAGETGLRERLQRAVDQVLDMQSGSGSFGMWGWGSDQAYDWLSVYALDFLIDAKAVDYVVPQDALNRGTNWLRRSAAQSWQSADTRAYGLYVLARLGAVNLADLRYFHDTGLDKVETPLAAAHLGAALAQMGDRSRALSAFGRAVRLSGHDIVPEKFSDYGSLLRDTAGVTALVANSGFNEFLPELFERIARLRVDVDALTTQEMAWMLLAAHAVQQAQGPLSVEVEGVSTLGKGPVYLASLTPENVAGVSVRNTGDKDAWYTLTVDGVPAEPLPAMSEGVTVNKAYLTLTGQRANLSKLAQSDQVIVLIEGKMPDVRRRQMAVLDLLPAGLEIESVLPSGSERSYRFLPALTAMDSAGGRDDRYVGAFTLQGRRIRNKDNTFTQVVPEYAVAYIARAVTPGSYVLPAVTIEDMYAPALKARTAMDRLTVEPEAAR